MAPLSNRFYFPGPNELDQVMRIICSMGPRWKKWTTALQILLLIQVQVLLSRHGVALPKAQRGVETERV